MHVWNMIKWRRFVPQDYPSGLRMRIDRTVDPDLRACLMAFSVCLRKHYQFPMRMTVYVRNQYRIRAKDGDMVVGTFWRPECLDSFPYIRLAVGDYEELVAERGEDGALWSILESFTHELTHYYQYINLLPLTLMGEERQAKRYARLILEEYDQWLYGNEEEQEGKINT